MVYQNGKVTAMSLASRRNSSNMVLVNAPIGSILNWSGTADTVPVWYFQ